MKLSTISKQKKYIWISIISSIIVITVIISCVLIYNRAQIKTFISISDMKSYINGTYTKEHNSILNYRLIIKDNYIIQEKYGSMNRGHGKTDNFISETKKYHILEYDYQNGKIITDKLYTTIREGSDILSTEKPVTYNTRKEFIITFNNEIKTDNHIYKRID